MTTPANAQAIQIPALSHVVPSYPSPKVVFDGYGIAPTVAGTGGVLVGQSSIAGVNGHSLGGYLATAFTRLFGGALGYNVQNVTTFNSAGFSINNLNSVNVVGSYNQVSQLIGSSLGLVSLDAVAALQTNYYGENGIEVTTNSWADDNLMAPGFHQYGQRVALYQESGLLDTPIPGVKDPASNHYIYKQTDLLPSTEVPVQTV